VPTEVQAAQGRAEISRLREERAEPLVIPTGLGAAVPREQPMALEAAAEIAPPMIQMGAAEASEEALEATVMRLLENAAEAEAFDLLEVMLLAQSAAAAAGPLVMPVLVPQGSTLRVHKL